MSDLNKNTLYEIVNLIKTKKISSLDVTKHFIKNIESGKNSIVLLQPVLKSQLKVQKVMIQKIILKDYFQVYLSQLKIYFVQKT